MRNARGSDTGDRLTEFLGSLPLPVCGDILETGERVVHQSDSRSHLTWAMPYQPGTISRTG
jgi:hypothetical protein